MDKVKVSQEVANAMKELESWIGADKDRSEKVLKIAELLAYGYEVEQTPEEQLKDLFDLTRKAWEEAISKKYDYHEQYQCGFKDGMLKTLNILNIKIKGVNTV